jgi:hypothetical protein
VIWVWNPNIVNPMPDVQLKPYWILRHHRAAHVRGVYGQTMAEIRQFTDKPFIIAETAVETGPSETDSVHSLITGVEEHGDVLGLIWFNYDKNGVDWTLDGRPVLRAAVAGSLAGMKLASLEAENGK